MCGILCDWCRSICGCGCQNQEANTEGPNKDIDKEPQGDENTSQEPDPSDSEDPFRPRPHRRIRRLWCQTGFDLAIYPNGTIQGTKSPKNKYGLLEFEALGMEGHIRIKGSVTGFFVTMTPKGRVHAQPLAENRGTIWVETGVGSGTSYHSLLSLDYAHKGYYLGIKRNGKPKEGPRTAHPYPQKATSFIQRIVSEEQ